MPAEAEGTAVDAATAALGRVPAARRELDRVEGGLIAEARSAGLSWRRVAAALGLGSPQATEQRAIRLGAATTGQGNRDVAARRRDRARATLPAQASTRSTDGPFNGQTGPYRLQVAVVPGADGFDVGPAPFTVSNGAPGPGAGNLETTSSKDTYRFTVPAGGQSIYVGWSGSPNNSGVANWQIVNDTTGAQITSSIYASDKQVDNLPAGTYRLEVTPFNGQTGPYGLQVRPV